jgi:hypothetical protein
MNRAELTGTSAGMAAVFLAASLWAAPQGAWQTITEASDGTMSIAPGSLSPVSLEVVSIWVRHRSAPLGPTVLERYEVHCGNQQRRLLEVWTRPDLADSAPAAQWSARWTQTEPNTTMREFVVQVCALLARGRH